ncbi:hypothetical protein PROFUN_08262 [Planoprotostelium fungivorum]|uniref:Uncharacterized protein n=1 Tax=Planoprotostelium fungivorum TaxID=1890364 RepID=A0A2P6NKB4_9EUKA|nr:hypothetical protein PROFUN_08262 [Planoprotostelium fungivorum]
MRLQWSSDSNNSPTPKPRTARFPRYLSATLSPLSLSFLSSPSPSTSSLAERIWLRIWEQDGFNERPFDDEEPIAISQPVKHINHQDISCTSHFLPRRYLSTKAVLKAGVNPKAQDDSGQAPLYYARTIKHDSAEFVQTPLKLG